MPAIPGRQAPVLQHADLAAPGPARNAFRLGPRTRRLIRSVARLVNPVAFPRYERLALRLIGINEFVWLRPAPMPDSGDPAPARPAEDRRLP